MQTDVPTVRERRWSARKRVEMQWRRATRSVRVLPDFLVVSGARCGSTSLFDIVCAHPQVMAPSHKEVHFFDRNHLRGLDFYRRVFPLEAHRRARERRLGRPVVTGEATTYYLLHPTVPERVAAALPDVRVIAMVRDPVDRAHSHYHLVVRNGRERLSFEEALDAEPERLRGEEERLRADPGYDSPPHRHYSYVERGLYRRQLERWRAVYPAEQLLVLRSEDVFADAPAAVRRVTDFLGLEPHPDPRRPPRNRASYEPMRPETRRRLQERFAGPNRELEDFLGVELGWQRPT